MEYQTLSPLDADQRTLRVDVRLGKSANRLCCHRLSIAAAREAAVVPIKNNVGSQPGICFMHFLN
jgi:hypothetical protein